jgi:ferredoxin--NADP+ reductase
VTSVVGFRNKDLVILEDEFKNISDEFVLTTDDGSYGEHGNVCVPLDRILASGKKVDKIFGYKNVISLKVRSVGTIVL